MKTLLRPLLITLASCLAATAFAQPPLQRSPAEMMKQADTDNDGKLSRDEFIKARTANLEEAFDKLDTDSSGALDQQELRAAADRLSPSPVGGREDTGGRRRPAQRPQPPTGERPRAGAMAAAAPISTTKPSVSASSGKWGAPWSKFTVSSMPMA